MVVVPFKKIIGPTSLKKVSPQTFSQKISLTIAFSSDIFKFILCLVNKVLKIQ